MPQTNGDRADSHWGDVPSGRGRGGVQRAGGTGRAGLAHTSAWYRTWLMAILGLLLGEKTYNLKQNRPYAAQVP